MKIQFEILESIEASNTSNSPHHVHVGVARELFDINTMRMLVVAVVLACVAPMVAHPVVITTPSPWCAHANAPAEIGMYGNIGTVVDISGPRGSQGQYADLPDNATVIGFFRQGLMQLWGFNHVEANRNFATAVALDPTCALCYWGVALAFGTNVNYVLSNQTAFNLAANKANALLHSQPHILPKTRIMIESLMTLVQDAPFRPDNASSSYRHAYADALCNATLPREENDTFDADLDALCSGALMDLAPWNYYEGVGSGGTYPMKPFLFEAKRRLLRAANAQDTVHPFAIHLLIHLLEPSNAPSTYRYEALNATDRLFNKGTDEMVPSQGHLTHMPAHLYLRVGQYYTAVDTSAVTIKNNQQYISQCIVPYGYGHNLKMLVANARFAGMYKTAVQYAIL